MVWYGMVWYGIVWYGIKDWQGFCYVYALKKFNASELNILGVNLYTLCY